MTRTLMKGLAVAIAMNGAGSVAMAETQPEMLELPIEGPLYMRETSAGTPVIVSADGRFVLPARLVDRELDHTVINSLDQAKEHFLGMSREQPEFLHEDGTFNPDGLLSFSIGEGEKDVYVWVDPLCPHCHTVLGMQEELGEQYTFHNLLVPMLGERSQQAVTSLSCMDEDQRRTTVMNRKDLTASAPEGECDAQRLSNNQQLAQTTGVRAVPAIVSPQQQQVTGAPRSVEAFVNFLEGNQ